MVGKQASWWTPSGWRRAPEPTPYNKRVGYTDLELSAESSSAVENNIYQNDDGHLYVTMQGNGESLATFFVSAEDAAAFWVDKYPAMINASAGFERRLLKTLVDELAVKTEDSDVVVRRLLGIALLLDGRPIP